MSDSDAIQLVIEPRTRDLGGFSVRRVLPDAKRQMVGPFIFFDHMGPVDLNAGDGIQVRPHPHIGLATVTYLFEGEILHRDSLGFVQPIRSGEVNLMTAGSGIVHSERASEDPEAPTRFHGIQSWIALPTGREEIHPSFTHYPKKDIPEFELDSVAIRLIMGNAFGHASPVRTYSPTLYFEARVPQGAALVLPGNDGELACYVIAGSVKIGEVVCDSSQMPVFETDQRIRIQAQKNSRIMVIGGEPVGERYIWWNFVASSKARIEKAKLDWKNDSFDPVPGDPERIPLPE